MLVIAVAGFRDAVGDLIPKEISFVSSNSKGEDGKMKMQTFHFQPPYSGKRQPPKARQTNKWIKKNLHGLDWEDGHIPYPLWRCLVREVCRFEKEGIYAKGSEQVKLLNDVLALDVFKQLEVKDLDKEGCPKASD